MEKALLELSAKQQIQELVLRYCRAVDRKDYQSLAGLYHVDSQDEHGGMFSGTGQEFVAWLPQLIENMQVTSHMVSNHLIEIDEDYA